jgi:Ca2+-binding EF-hand superfamily protein
MDSVLDSSLSTAMSSTASAVASFLSAKDRDFDGRLSLAEFRSGLASLGLAVSEKQVASLFSAAGKAPLAADSPPRAESARVAKYHPHPLPK